MSDTKGARSALSILGGPLDGATRQRVYDALDALEAEVARLRKALRQMQCTCLTGPHAPSVLDGTMCPRCVALKEADDE